MRHAPLAASTCIVVLVMFGTRHCPSGNGADSAILQLGMNSAVCPRLQSLAYIYAVCVSAAVGMINDIIVAESALHC